MPASVRILLILSLLLWGGCIGRNNCCPGVQECSLETPFCECIPADPHVLVPDVSQVPIAAAPHSRLFCALAEQDTQCQAAAQATIANLLAREADVIPSSNGLIACRANGELVREVMLLNSAHQRNLAAGGALEVFLRLVEAEAGLQNLEQRLQEVDRMLNDIEQLTSRGMLPPVPKSQIQGQRLELLHQQLELMATIQRLNRQLAEMLNCQLPPDSYFWPQATLVVDPVIPASEEAVMLALGNRSDLAALRLASQSSERDQAELATRLLPQLHAGLGSAGSAKLLRLSGQSAGDNQVRADQVQLAAADRERQIQNEALQAVSVLQTRLGQIDLTRQRLVIARGQVDSLEQQMRIATGSPFNVRKARLDLLAVEQDLLHDVIEWKVAQVKLKQAQGLLAIECGYGCENYCRSNNAF